MEMTHPKLGRIFHAIIKRQSLLCWQFSWSLFTKMRITLILIFCFAVTLAFPEIKPEIYNESKATEDVPNQDTGFSPYPSRVKRWGEF